MITNRRHSACSLNAYEPANITSNMIQISMCFIRQLLLASLLMMVPVAIATADPAGSVSASPPLTMARFYVIGSDGRSVSDRSIPVQTRSQHRRSSNPRQVRSDRRQRDVANNAREHSDSKDWMNSGRNKTTAWQCEQHGYFFTVDGRCIRPIIHVNQRPPPRISRRPIQGKLTPK